MYIYTCQFRIMDLPLSSTSFPPRYPFFHNRANKIKATTAHEETTIPTIAPMDKPVLTSKSTKKERNSQDKAIERNVDSKKMVKNVFTWCDSNCRYQWSIYTLAGNSSRTLSCPVQVNLQGATIHKDIKVFIDTFSNTTSILCYIEVS